MVATWHGGYVARRFRGRVSVPAVAFALAAAVLGQKRSYVQRVATACKEAQLQTNSYKPRGAATGKAARRAERRTAAIPGSVPPVSSVSVSGASKSEHAGGTAGGEGGAQGGGGDGDGGGGEGGGGSAGGSSGGLIGELEGLRAMGSIELARSGSIQFARSSVEHHAPATASRRQQAEGWGLRPWDGTRRGGLRRTGDRRCDRYSVSA